MFYQVFFFKRKDKKKAGDCSKPQKVIAIEKIIFISNMVVTEQLSGTCLSICIFVNNSGLMSFAIPFSPFYFFFLSNFCTLS